ncbi:MAG: threonine--tRNA ligase [Saccharofermentanales bacterium]
MNKNFKTDLRNNLILSVNRIIGNFELADFQMTEDGFYCDFDLDEPLDPEKFGMISENMKNADATGFYELARFSGVYRNGDSSSKMLQRIYVIAFETEVAFKAYKDSAIEASSRDHRILGPQMKLFSSSEEIGQGLVLWNPKGAMIRYLVEQFGQAAHILNDYQWVYTPHIGKSDLWKTSGHLDFYKESMYSPISIDGDEYYLKPMNCPFHIDIYNNEVHSYRDLPVRLAEYGTVYRYELSGVLSGLTRVRGFTQDDAHIICTPEQIDDEVSNALKFSLYILRAFGFSDFNIYISTKPAAKFIGDDNAWILATETLKKAVMGSGLEFKIDEGGGAFYGPKIDLKLKDALNREWQCSTIQFDFNLPDRFKMFYIGSDGKKHTPVMVHRALFGSLERFTALLIEHYKGDFPFWFTPLQFGIVPIKAVHNDYCRKLAGILKNSGYRIKVNYDDVNMRKKIKDFEVEKSPYILIVGDDEMQKESFSLRSRNDGNLGMMNLDELNVYFKSDLELGKPKCIF